MKITLSNLKTPASKYNHNYLKILTRSTKYFSTSINQKEDQRTSLYIWKSNVIRGKIKENFFSLRTNIPHDPIKIEYFEGKNPKQIFNGPRHSGVITEDGNLYTFGDGYRGVLGIGHDLSIPYRRPRLVKYFAENKIKIKKIFLGDCHSMALSEDGDLYTWGYGGKLRTPFSFYKGN